MTEINEIASLAERELDVLFELLDFDSLETDNNDSEEFSIDDIKYKCDFQYGVLENKKTILTFKFYIVDGPKTFYEKTCNFPDILHIYNQ